MAVSVPLWYHAAAMTPLRLILVPLLGATAALASGCVRRTITITSTPPGALVWVNDQEVGRTPVEIDFVYYGTYDVRLNRDGYEPLLTTGEAAPPLWDSLGADFFAEIAPARLKSEVAWHYELEPADDDPEALRERAGEMRDAAATVDPPRGQDDSAGR